MLALFFGVIVLQSIIIWKLLTIEKKIDLISVPSKPVEGVADRIKFYIKLKDGTMKELGGNMFLKITEALPLLIAVKDAQGNAAKVDGVPQWAVTDDALATLEVAADGFSALVKPKGPIGAFKVQVRADADLGEPVKEILGELDIDLVAGEAVKVEISAGQPQPL